MIDPVNHRQLLEPEIEDRTKQNRCCICSGLIPLAELVLEERPTGECFAIEEWSYCLSCWNYLVKLREADLNWTGLFRQLGQRQEEESYAFE